MMVRSDQLIVNNPSDLLLKEFYLTEYIIISANIPISFFLKHVPSKWSFY